MKNITKNNKEHQFRKSMQAHGIDVDSFQQEQRLSSKILEKIIGGSGKGDPNNIHAHSKHNKVIDHAKCVHRPKTTG